ncbi:hypothetical protein FKM82_002800 [Ascaphus truei]
MAQACPELYTAASSARINWSKCSSLLKGVKGDFPVTYLRSEFNNTLLGDSQKLELSPDKPTEFSFTTSFDVGADSLHSLDDIAHKPVILTLIEVLPKEKKKEEKTVVLGQTAVDLLPLLKGECNFKTSLPLYPVTGSPLETVRTNAKPSLEVAVSVPEPLLSEAQQSNGNLLRVTVEAAYLTPESWSMAGPQYNYVINLQIPIEKECSLLFSNGALKAGGEKETVPRQKKWPISNITAPAAQHIPESFILGGEYNEEVGDLNQKEDKQFRTDAETLRKRVTWDTERRCYLDPSAVISLQKRIAECRCWPVEIMRVPLSTTMKAKTGKTDRVDEDSQISFHGVAYVNMVSLLYPGIKCLRGAFRIYPYQEAEMFDKTKCQSNIQRDFMRQTSIMSKFVPASLIVNSPHPKQTPSRIIREDKGGREKDVIKKMASMAKPSEMLMDIEGAVQSISQNVSQNVEGQQYGETGTYIVLELALEKPLVPKRMAEEMALRVKELIPPRPELSRRTAGAQKAVADYQSQITSITNSILDEYCELFGQQEADGREVDRQTLEEQKCQLNYELNCSGKYFAFKEQIKHAVVKIVREKYMKTTAFEDPEQLQAFLSDLYVYLVDQMHIALNQTLFDNREEQPAPPMTDMGQLLRFAKEAEITEDFKLAEMYYQERLARDRQCVDHWLDYGSFKLLIGDNIKAQECFHEAVILNREHLHRTDIAPSVHSLLLCGITAVLMDHYSDAEVFFEDATCVNPSSVLAWTMLGLFYEIQGNDIRMEMAFSEAGKFHQAQLAPERSSAPTGETRIPDSARVEMAEASDKGAVSKGGTEVTSGNVPILPRDQAASAELSMVSRKPEDRNSTSSSLSTIRSKSKSASQKGAGTNVSTVSAHKANSFFMETILFLARVNAMQIQFVQMALAHELLSPDGGPSCKYHLLCAQMHLTRKEFKKANKNLQEASQMDHQNPDVWALTGHLQFLSGTKREAQCCYEHTINLVADASEMHPVYLRLGSIYLEEGQYEKAKDTYLRACKSSPTCLTWLGVGIACYRLGEMKEAQDALTEANTLNNSNAEVWGYLALVCMKTGRQLEAEQSYKYTRKLNLQDQHLMTEIHEMQEQVGFGNPSF